MEGYHPYTKFRGVVAVSGERWGARVILNQKQIWLGTFDCKEEAAIAYDRVSLKLMRRALNFPLVVGTFEEAHFQEMYPLESIVAMIKDRTYDLMFSTFLSHDSSWAERHFLAGTSSRFQAGDTTSVGPSNAHEPIMLFGARIN